MFSSGEGGGEGGNVRSSIPPLAESRQYDKGVIVCLKATRIITDTYWQSNRISSCLRKIGL